MAVRIQLASNFQVVELTYDSWDEVVQEEVDEATELVNELGAKVKNEIKTKKEEKKEEMASEGQIKWLKNLGISEADAKKMTKKEAWQMIQDSKK